jgi:hypothetical protein
MRSDFTGHVTPTEWRWVILVSTALVSLAFIPFLWVLLIGLAGSQWQFMGALHDHVNGAADLSRIYQGTEGAWMVRFLHTPQPHDGALFNPLYSFLGHISWITSLSPVVIFHVARVGAALFMYMALYQLAASIWMRVRSRRIFFVLAALGSGFGWLLSPLTANPDYLDLIAPQAFPFYSTLVNVHYPLAIACLALIASVIVVVFRPGETEDPHVNNGGLVIFIAGLILVLIYPLAFVTMATALLICIIMFWYRKKRITDREFRWLLWFGVPGLPLLVYYGAVLAHNPVVAAIWRQQNSALPPSPLVFVLSLGLLIFIALPGFRRALRHFELDGDQFMLLWFIVIILLVYLPIGIQQRFLLGIMIPLAYFATRSIEDFWFNRLNRPWRWRLIVAILPLLAASHLFVLYLPLQPISRGSFGSAAGLLLQRDYLETFNWLRDHTRPGDVILASPAASVWLPAWTGARVVYGHPQETANAAAMLRAVLSYYQADDTPEDCAAALSQIFSDNGEFRVRFVLVGPQERQIGEAACADLLTPIGNFGGVRIYSTTEISRER